MNRGEEGMGEWESGGGGDNGTAPRFMIHGQVRLVQALMEPLRGSIIK